MVGYPSFRIVATWWAAGAIAILAGCRQSPSPTTASPMPSNPVVTAPVLPVSVPLSPDNSAEIPLLAANWAQYEVTLVASDTPFAGTQPVIDTFQIAGDPSFSRSLYEVHQLRGQDNRTELRLHLNGAQGQVNYWRVRASSGEVIGPFSAPSTFAVTSAMSAGAPPSTPPALVEPVHEATRSRFITLKAARTERATMPVRIAFEVRTSNSWPDTTSAFYCQDDPRDVLPGAVASCDVSLAPGTYYWRARMVYGGLTWGSPNLGPASEVRRLTVTGERLDRGTPIEPVRSAAVRNPVQLVVANAPRTQGIRSVTYHFVVRRYGNPLAEADIVEDPAGRTRWTIPFDLPVGAAYSWTVVARDSTTGDVSRLSAEDFGVFSAVDVPYLLTVTPPDSCKPSLLQPWSRTVFLPQITTASFQALRFSTPFGSLAGQLTSDNGVVTGTMRGDAVWANSSSLDPVILSATLDSSYAIRGTFSGYVIGVDPYGDGGRSCTAPDFAFTLVRQL